MGLNALEAILDAAQELFVARGFKATAVKDIAAAVGAKDAPLYNHFVGNSRPLFDGIIQRDLAYPKTALTSWRVGKRLGLDALCATSDRSAAGSCGKELRQRAAAMSCWERQGSERERPPCTVRRRASTKRYAEWVDEKAARRAVPYAQRSGRPLGDGDLPVFCG